MLVTPHTDMNAAYKYVVTVDYALPLLIIHFYYRYII